MLSRTARTAATSSTRHHPRPHFPTHNPTPSTSRHIFPSTPHRIHKARAHGSPRFAPRESLRFALEEDNKSDADGEAQPSTSASTSAESTTASATASSLPPSPPPPEPDALSSSLVIQPTPFPTPPASAAFVVPRVPFSTHRFVRELEHGGIERPMAEDVMSLTKKLLLKHEEIAGDELLSRAGLENEAYLFTAALSELKTESQVKSRNDGITLRSMTSALQREADAVSQKMKEDIARLSNEIQLDMNTRKEETSGDLKNLDMSIMDLNSKFTILLGEVRTEIEATKWISTRRVMSAIVFVVVAVIAIVSSNSSSTPPPSPPPLPTVEELGLKRAGEEADVGGSETNSGGGSWFWSTPSTSAGTGSAGTGKKEKRVEGEGDGES